MHPRKTELAELGYTVIPDYMGDSMLDRIRARVDELFVLEGDAAGSEFRTEENARRLANLVDKGEVFREAIVRKEILELVASVLGKSFKLGSLNVRSAIPNQEACSPCTWIWASAGRERICDLQLRMDARRLYARKWRT